MTAVDRITQINKTHLPGVEPILEATVRQRIDAIREAAANQHWDNHWEAPEILLMILGALSALATVGYVAIPESLFDKLVHTIICFNTMNRDEVDPGERYPQ